MILSVAAYATTLPDTGQTKCYDDTQEITCPNPGEPFYGQDAQYIGNQQSYTKLDASGNDLPDEATEWVMVRDNLTGLIWEIKQDKDNVQNYSNPHDADNRYTWYDGTNGIPRDGTDTLDLINALNDAHFGGFNDWRLPTIKEPFTIADSSMPCTPSGGINTNYFPNTMSSGYWSSTPYAGSSIGVWTFYCGGTSYHSIVDAYYSAYVRAVRGESYGPFGNYIDNGDGTVTDIDTCLTWQKDTAPGTYTWEQALAYCENLELAGHKDWRLPNKNELQSIVDYNRYNPSVDPVFYNTSSNRYWSSTSGATDAAWRIGFQDGFVGGSSKWSAFYVRAVRAGQCGCPGDLDCDGVADDGDNSGISGDNPCTGGQTTLCDDNCPDDSNAGQEDADSDEAGDACDNCPDMPNQDQNDTDLDFEGDVCDICPNHYNPRQEDTDGSGVGDACNDEIDADADEWENSFDNCPNAYNPLQIDCDSDGAGDMCDDDTIDHDDDGVDTACDNCPSASNANQLDTYPPDGNGIGDACDCEGNLNCDGDVDGSDAATFKTGFGRSMHLNPCTAERPCPCDFDCDHDCDGVDAVLVKQDFGRSAMQNPCPVCVAGEEWCSY